MKARAGRVRGGSKVKGSTRFKSSQSCERSILFELGHKSRQWLWNYRGQGKAQLAPQEDHSCMPGVDSIRVVTFREALAQF